MESVLNPPEAGTHRASNDKQLSGLLRNKYSGSNKRPEMMSCISLCVLGAFGQRMFRFKNTKQGRKKGCGLKGHPRWSAGSSESAFLLLLPSCGTGKSHPSAKPSDTEHRRMTLTLKQKHVRKGRTGKGHL